jgi:hypothetical protein
MACGGEGQNCCYSQQCLGYYSLCTHPMLNTNICSSACGHPGEPCCAGNLCRDGGCCMVDDHGADKCVNASTCGCAQGSCTTCGEDGGPCCAGGLCGVDQGMCNDAGVCAPPPIMHP